MRLYLLTLMFISLFVLPAGAQKKFSAYLENYQHTITYPDHKVTLHVQPDDKTLSYTDLTKSYYWYSNNQIKITQGGFSGKLLHGLYSSYYENRNLQEQGNFKMGLKNGEWKSWTTDGLLKHAVNYHEGIYDGIFYQYNEQGKLIEQGSYKTGLKSGEWKSWAEDGHLKNVTNFQNGIPEGDFYKYNEQGKLIEKGWNHEGKLDRELIRYQGDSTLKTKYKDGVIVPPKVKTKTSWKWIDWIFKNKTKEGNNTKPVK